MSRPPAVHVPFGGVFTLSVFKNNLIKRRLNTSKPLKITPLQREDPDVCHDPLPYVVRIEERLHFMFLKITQLNDVLTSRILWKSHLYREGALTEWTFELSVPMLTFCDQNWTFKNHENHTFSDMVDHFKTLKILNYHLKLSGPRFSHLDRPPIFAAYILILQRSRAWAPQDFGSNATNLEVC